MEVVAQNTLLPKNIFASLAGFLGFHTHWNTISTFRHLALYSKRFQTSNFAPKLLAICVTESV